MPLSRVKVWAAGDKLYANDLNNEFDHLVNNVLFEPVVLSQNIDINGKTIILDDDGNTTLDASTNDTVTLAINGANDFRFTANTFTALAGSSITVAQGNVNLTQGDVAFTAGRTLWSKGADVASASTITVPSDANTFDITGTVTITAFSTVQAGAIFYARFTGIGLNITYNATSMITPWARDYRTIQNEVLAFWSLGSGNWIFWSLNGPKERVGVTIEANVSSAPAGYLDEDGTAVSRATYPGLFQEIGTTYGSGNGTTTFNTPDSRGRTTINVDGSANRITASSVNGANADTLGGVGGAETHTLIAAEMPIHAHTFSGQTVNSGGGGNAGTGVGAGDYSASGTDNAGSSNAHSNTQPWIAKKKFLRF